ncbi:Uncharacterized protein TCM_031020 [Theobroma cacao]|uniref:Uncharacterized protein n=1 Tax=Theobroma cacao TaxID=3641 RepID=A0A061F572_THECC|nr:Uncharacterized protein TCM_031020 [Theobroma cacao]
MPEGTHRLCKNCSTSLQELSAKDCHNWRAWRDWIPNLTSLKELKICECLESQYLQKGVHSLTSSQLFWIYNCLNLSSSRQSLKTLVIRDCPNLTSNLCSSRVMRHPWSSLQELSVQNCPNLDLGDLQNRIPKITSVKTREICKCSELQDLPGMGHLTPLQVLSINEFPQLSKRCEKVTGILWPYIAYISSIIIDGKQIQ